MVRHATSADKMACIRLLRQSHQAAGFDYPFQAAYAAQLFEQHLASNQACVLVLEHGEHVSGLLMAAWFEHPFGAGRYAKETVWFIAPQARGRSALKMLAAYEAWARGQGCTAIGMAALAGNDVSKIYQRCGYEPAETHFLKSL
ncbi:GNAT family N-acetyltransferase [Pseudochrobactrum sp. HB0163]|uniref:GNAT family N-acetyltransferase n=1 Tax=Pseudochrobactrum sp. HB0163 TaxID=3450708 RepID=UPI003F6DC5C8